MKKPGNSLFGVAALVLWAFAAVHGANAQDNPQPVAGMVADNTVAPPTALPDMDANSPLGKVVGMLQSGVSESQILAYISNSSAPFDLSSNDWACLNDLGTPTAVETALTRRNQELGVGTGLQSPEPQPAVSRQTQAPQDVTADYFFGALAPYGTWINMPGYGLCWQPRAVNYNADWAPYCTSGQWIYTDSGWYWLSGYSWGWCVFHYGRWFHDAQHGWLWWPSSTWAPSWVFWRSWGGYCGWAPVPPHCYYSEEKGLVYNGAPVASGYDFGIGANLFDFVPMANIFDGNTERFLLSAAQSAQVFARSKVLADINSNDRIIVNDGIPVSRIASATGGDIRSYTIQPVESVATPGARGEQILPDGETLAINRPYFINAPSALRQGIWPVPAQEQPVAHQRRTIIVNQIPYSYPSGDDEDNSVIYVDSAAQNGPPVPTVTTDGPQDYPANASGGGAPAQSYWASSMEAPAPEYGASGYMSPRSQSHQRWQRKVQQPANRQEFNPSGERSGSAQGSESHPPSPEQRTGDAPHPSPSSSGASSHSHSSGSSAPAHSGSSGQSHGH